jgi:hypothetical protein
MSAWVTITADDLRDYLVAAQVTALRTAALGSGQADPFTRTMQDRCNYVRNRISNRISISATAYAVPPELRTQTCMLIIEAMQPRLLLPLSKDQTTAIARAYDDLKIAGTKELPISTPDDALTPEVQTAAGVEVASSITRKATRDTLAGL